MTNTLRRILTTLAFITGVCLITPGGGPSVEEMFVATTEAAEETEGAMCLMPDGVDGPAEAGHSNGTDAASGVDAASHVVSGLSRTGAGQSRMAIRERREAAGGGLAPVRRGSE